MTAAPEQLHPLILDSITDGVFTVDAEFRLTSLNAEAERITGLHRSEAIGRRCYDVLRGSACQGGCPLKRSIETGEPQRNIRVTMLDVDMRSIPICVSTAVMRDREGKLVGGVEIFRDISEIESLRKELSGRGAFGEIIGSSPAMQEIFRLIVDVAETDASVLIEGESGTGKELVARAIHDSSPRRDKPFVTVNCGALPDTLLESELFGYVRGAFTDAHRNKPGRFQQADGGTLFLDEVGDLSAAFQVKLLRALQEGEVQPLGGTDPIAVNVRVVAATNRNLGQLMHDGSFRQDLYYRLCVVPIHVPPLRERREDIIPLLEHLLPRLATRTGKPINEISAAALTCLYDHDYPGNVRELGNILERATVLCHGDQIELIHLPPALARMAPSSPGQPVASDDLEGALPTAELEPAALAWQNLKPSERRVLSTGQPPSGPSPVETKGATHATQDPARARPEVRRLIETLNAHSWNRGATAQACGISRTTLWRRMKDYGLA